MGPASQSPTNDANGYEPDGLPAKGHSDRKPPRRRSDPDLSIAENVLTHEAVCVLLEQWLVPVVVDDLMRELLNFSVGEVR